MTLWRGTIVEQLRDELRTHPATALAYAVGNAELRVFLLFGCEPDSSEVPDEARKVAAMLLDALMCGGDLEQVARDCSTEIAKWRAGRNLQ
ncbi:hypothetical protein QFW77_15235 [Luteimonas sp. RD2P54]|uniref:Uncharacterized protein n=1 Tax=Luteimonas endophytica TaxID=3042023 RepID=A0ABT6JBX7_9GAMM|nr:hypothetical protein [Luteimonas endophytica]MDH5824328.1 hypothetical protein [Luteimonas endophytica]